MYRVVLEWTNKIEPVLIEVDAETEEDAREDVEICWVNPLRREGINTRIIRVEKIDEQKA